MRDKTEFYRTYCLENHAIAVRDGYFLAARHMLRRALRFKQGCRKRSRAYGYLRFNGKLVSYQYGN